MQDTKRTSVCGQEVDSGRGGGFCNQKECHPNRGLFGAPCSSMNNISAKKQRAHNNEQESFFVMRASVSRWIAFCAQRRGDEDDPHATAANFSKRNVAAAIFPCNPSDLQQEALCNRGQGNGDRIRRRGGVCKIIPIRKGALGNVKKFCVKFCKFRLRN